MPGFEPTIAVLLFSVVTGCESESVKNLKCKTLPESLEIDTENFKLNKLGLSCAKLRASLIFSGLD